MRRQNDLSRRAAWCAVVFAAVFPATKARAAELVLRADPPFGWVGEPALLEVAIVDPPDGIAYPTFPEVEGLRIGRLNSQGTRVEPDPQTRRMVRTITLSYQVASLTRTPGTFTIGPAVAQRDGAGPLRSNAIEFSFYRRRDGGGLGIKTACRVEPTSGPVGAPFRVYYEIFHALPLEELTALELPVLKELPREWLRSLAELPGCASQQLRLRDGTVLYLHSGAHPLPDGYAEPKSVLAFEVTPYTTGSLALGGGLVAAAQATGEFRRERGFIFDQRVPVLQESRAEFPAARYEILPLPAVNRPATFNGAIGSYKLTVNASPTMVDAFAPITLELVVEGDGYLPKVPPPPLTAIPELTKSFDVDTTTDPGEIEGERKTFRQIIRPRDGDVKEIPPLPFAFFDPRLKTYRVVHSAAIPIEVRSVRTVGARDAIASTHAPAPGAESAAPPVAAPIFSRSGVAANRSTIGRIESALDPRAELTSPSFLAVVGAPPLAFAALVLVRRRGARDPRVVRARFALAAARHALARQEIDHDAVSHTFQQYFRDRLGLGQGELTPLELSAALARTGLDAPTIEKARVFLEELLAGRFGGAGDAPAPLARRALELLADIEATL